MAIATSGKTTCAIDLTYKDSGDISNVEQPLAVTYDQSWTTSTAGKVYAERISLTGASVNRDLYGSLTDRFGNTISAATVRALWIINRATTAGYDLTVTGSFMQHSVIGATGSLTVRAGGKAIFEAPLDGYAVVATDDDVITLDPGANTFDVDLIVICVE